jgi:hypothetical protein
LNLLAITDSSNSRSLSTSSGFQLLQ